MIFSERIDGLIERIGVVVLVLAVVYLGIHVALALTFGG